MKILRKENYKMIRKSLAIAGSMVLLCTTVSVNAQSTFEIKGKVNNKYDKQWAYLSYTDNKQVKRDSAKIIGGNFSLKGTVLAQARAKLSMINSQITNRSSLKVPANEQEFYIERGTINLVGDSLGNAMIKGGQIQSDFNSLRSLTDPMQYQLNTASTGGSSQQVANRGNMMKLQADLQKTKFDFVDTHPDSYISLVILYELSGPYITPEVVAKYDGLSERLRNSEGGKQVGAKMEVARRTTVGQKAMEITQNDVDGKAVTLSSMRGKYVLIDFWASWCIPCRAENPNVLRVYQRFKDKNFDVMGVSIDVNREAWLKAIKEDGMPWVQVSDLEKRNSAAVSYGVSAIPMNFLISPEGIIIARNLRGANLERTLADLIK